MKIGIFGGSFNPIHNGHVQLAKNIIASGMIDELWFMVSPHNPLKKESGLLPDTTRLTLAIKALDGIKGVRVSDFDFSLPKPSYMYNTLNKLQERYPLDEFVLIIGADNWLCFDKWKKHSEIIRKHKIIIYPRKDCEIDIYSLPAGITYLNMPLYNISSTQIREMEQAGKDISGLVP